MSDIILASASPRRQELLALIIPDFRVVPSDFDESTLPATAPEQHVIDSARAKADDVAVRMDDAVVIGADTIVVVDNEILGKPTDAGDAERMLHRLSGRSHYVYTGICVIRRSAGETLQTLADLVRTEVVFAELSEQTIDAYVATGEPLDKAGAYGIQEKGSVLVEGIVGDYFAVVGLPVFRLSRMLCEVAVPLFSCL